MEQDMKQELNEILDKMNQLNAMGKSIKDFNDKLNEMQASFIEKHYGYKRGDNVNIFELLSKAKT